MKRRTVTITSSVTIITVVLLGIPSLAAAQSDSSDQAAAVANRSEPLLLSNDGTVWDTTLPRPLFDAAHRYVPGELLESGFWILNNSGHPAFYTVQATNVNLDAGLAGALSLTIGGDKHSSAALIDCMTVVSNTPIAAGERLYLPSTISVSNTAPLEARNRSASFGIGTTLHDAPLTVADGQCLTDDGSIPPPVDPIDTDPIDTDPPATQPPAPPQESGAETSQITSKQSQLALTGAFVGIWALLAAAISAGGILIGFRKRKATHE